MEIHPTAVVEPGTVLGAGVKVGPFSYIQAGATLGDRCEIGPHVTILGTVTLGDRCQVHAGAVLGDKPQDLKFQEVDSYVQIGSDCMIREGATVHRGTQPGSTTTVGDQCLLMAQSHVGHNVQIGNQVVLANGALIAGHAIVGDRAFISGNCLVHQFTRIGRLVMMSGGSAVQQDVLPFCMTRSMTSNTVIGLNSVGLRRAGIDPTERRLLKRAFQILYKENSNIAIALDQLTAELGQVPLVQEMIEFARQSDRGICQAYRRRRV